MLRIYHKFLKKNSLTYKWGYFTLWLHVVLLRDYTIITTRNTLKGIQSIVLFKNIDNIMVTTEICINFNIISEEETAQIFKIYFEAFKLQGYKGIRIVLKDYQKSLIHFITKAFGERYLFDIDKPTSTSLKLLNRNNENIIYIYNHE